MHYCLLFIMIACLGSAADVLPPRGLCVFDYDNTMTRGMGYWDDWNQCKSWGPTEEQCGAPLPMDMWWQYDNMRIFAGVYAAHAIEACKLNNMRIGLASASSCPDVPNVDPMMISRVGLLEKLGFPQEVVPGDGQIGPAYACLNSSVFNKGQMVSRLIAYYGVPPEHTVFFDDYQGFLDDVVRPPDGQPAVHTVLASSGKTGCHGWDMFCSTACGLSEKETEAGLRQVLGRQPVMPHARPLNWSVHNYVDGSYMAPSSCPNSNFFEWACASIVVICCGWMMCPPRRDDNTTARPLLEQE